jgi:UDP-glucose 4-epimerase
MKTILIVGSTGFIGRNLREYFSINSDFLLLTPTRQQLNLLSDIDCESYLKHYKPDIVIHAAVDILSVENTLKMFFNIFNQKSHYGALIQIGSGAEYDKRTYSPMIQECEFGKSIPVDTYGLAKYLISREMESNQFGLNLRVFGIFGPHENFHRRFISNNICRVLAGFPISINRDMRFDYIEVDDLARGILKIVNSDPLSEVSYNFCSGKPVLLSEIALMIQSEMNCSLSVNILNSGNNPEYSGSPQKLIKEMGEFEFTPIKDSIKKLIDFYVNHFSNEQLVKFKESIVE